MTDNTEFFHLMRQRFQEAETAESENRLEGLDDLRFVHNYQNSQWATRDINDRTVARRPIVTHNLLRKFLRSLLGAMKQSRPGIKVLPVDTQDDLITAEIMTDLIRQIENDNESPATQAYDKAYEGALSNGFGYLRIITKYEGEYSFDQKIQVRRIANPFTVLFDPKCTNMLNADADYCFVHTVMDRKDFEKKYPDKRSKSTDSPGGLYGESYEGWYLQDAVRITEYFYKVPVVKMIAQLDDLSVVELTSAVLQGIIQSGKQILRQKKVLSHKYMWAKVSGDEFLEEPKFWPGNYIPIVPVYGDEINIEGKRILFSFFRDAKDPQRMYNFWLTAATEIVALSPKAPFIGTTRQFKGHEDQWKQANIKNFPYLTYEPDPKAPPPHRQEQSILPAGHITMLEQAQSSIMNTLGMFEASLGERSNERSGKAILARRAASERTTFTYIDNFYQSLLWTGYLLVDLIPKIYDTTRILRLKGVSDETMRFIQINTPYYDIFTNSTKLMYDLTSGHYDTELDIGAAHATRRQEAAESMMEFVQYIPSAGALVADLIAKNMDWPGAREIAERLKGAIMPQQQQQPQ